MTNYQASCSWPQFYHLPQSQLEWYSHCESYVTLPGQLPAWSAYHLLPHWTINLLQPLPPPSPPSVIISEVHPPVLSTNLPFALSLLLEGGIDLEPRTEQFCVGENKKWGGSSEIVTETIIQGFCFRGRCKMKIKYFGQTPSPTTSDVFLFLTNTKYQIPNTISLSSNSSNHANPPVPLFICFVQDLHIGVKISCTCSPVERHHKWSFLRSSCCALPLIRS